MTYEIISGYSGIFRSPMENLDTRGTSIYCLTTDSKRTLVAIPLTPIFFTDLYHIIKHPQYQKLILVVPSTDCVYISDIYNLYGEVVTNLGKEFQLVCPEEVKIPTSDSFLTHVVHGRHIDITVMHDQFEQLAAIVDFKLDDTSPAREVADIILSTPKQRIYFAMYMTPEKLCWLKKNPQYYTEIHMPFTNVTYGGSDYMEIRQAPITGIISKIRVHSFRTTEECEYCRTCGFPYGEVIYNDLV